MIYELTTSRPADGAIEDYLETGTAYCHTLLTRHLEIVGDFAISSGAAPALVRLVAYDDHDHREAAQSALRADAEWRAFRRDRRLIEDDSILLNPVHFSDLRDRTGLDVAITHGTTHDAPMLFELRTYTVIPGSMPNALRMLMEEGNPLTHQYVEWPVGYFTAETGITNRVMMFWAYASAGERAKRKARMLADPRFQELGSRFNLNFSEQRSVLLTPTPSSKFR